MSSHLVRSSDLVSFNRIMSSYNRATPQLGTYNLLGKVVLKLSEYDVISTYLQNL